MWIRTWGVDLVSATSLKALRASAQLPPFSRAIASRKRSRILARGSLPWASVAPSNADERSAAATRAPARRRRDVGGWAIRIAGELTRLHVGRATPFPPAAPGPPFPQ